MTITHFSISPLFFPPLLFTYSPPISHQSLSLGQKPHPTPLSSSTPARAISALAPSSLSAPCPGALHVCPPRCRHPRSAPKVQRQRPTLGRVVVRLDAAIRAPAPELQRQPLDHHPPCICTESGHSVEPGQTRQGNNPMFFLSRILIHQLSNYCIVHEKATSCSV